MLALPCIGENQFPALWGHATVLRGDQLLVFGGTTDGDARRCSDHVWSYSFDSQSWESSQPEGFALARRYGHTAVLNARGDVVLYGGQGNNGDLTYYDHANAKFEPVTLVAGSPTPPLRLRHTALMGRNRQMIMFGGYAKASKIYLNDFWVFTFTGPREGRWEMVNPERGAPRPSGREGASVVRFGSSVIVFGGNKFNDVWSLDLGTGRWGQLATTNAPPGRSGHAVVRHGRRMVVHGGRLAAGLCKRTYVLDLATLVWECLPETDVEVTCWATANLRDDELVLLGGLRESPAGLVARYRDLGPIPSWDEVLHAGYPRSIRAAIQTVLLCARRDGNAARPLTLGRMPLELLFWIFDEVATD